MAGWLAGWRLRRVGPAPWLAWVATWLACVGAVPAVAAPEADVPGLTVQERQCRAAGWQRAVLTVAGLPRRLMWKLPPDWSGAAVLVLHGGGGSYTHFCVANVPLIEPQLRLSELALARGLAVFLLDSHDQVTDREGHVCGKVWDDEPRPRDNLDLPFIEQVLRERIPALRPAGARSDNFLVGLSSGGYMAVRAASHWGALVTAIAPVASGDPYGWTRDCTRRPGDRALVAGLAYDNDTGRQIVEPGACAAEHFTNERPWDGEGARRPSVRVFHHAQDGIHDASCVQRLRTQLVAHGFDETPPFTLHGGGRRAAWHFWQDAYNAPIVDYLLGQLR